MNDTPRQENLQTARGMHDILPEQAERYAELEDLAREMFRIFEYQEIRTPVLEPVELFVRAVGEATDIVEKEMFTFKDRGDRVLCLRPEGTAGVVRSFIENSLALKYARPKFFYIGPMFRAERPQKGRYREFEQIGLEYFGDPNPAADVEAITFVPQLLKKYNAPVQIYLNTIGCPNCRPEYVRKLLEYLKSKAGSLCGHCQSRIEKNPLRVLDCKEDAAKLADAPRTLDSLCRECRDHFDEVRDMLKTFQFSFEINPRLVRGLDYYTRTVFEIYPVSQTGSQDALAAGGRYDGLVELLGGQPTPAVGFALGVERVLSYVEQTYPKREADRRSVFIAPIGAAASKKATELMFALRRAAVPASAGYPSQSLKSLLREADRIGSRFCVILGDNELRDGSAAVKNLAKQSQETVPLDTLIEYLKKELSAR